MTAVFSAAALVFSGFTIGTFYMQQTTNAHGHIASLQRMRDQYDTFISHFEEGTHSHDYWTTLRDATDAEIEKQREYLRTRGWFSLKFAPFPDYMGIDMAHYNKTRT